MAKEYVSHSPNLMHRPRCGWLVGSRAGVVAAGEPIRCYPFPVGPSRELHRDSVSSPRLIARSMWVARIRLSDQGLSQGMRNGFSTSDMQMREGHWSAGANLAAKTQSSEGLERVGTVH